jgi:hypothetical protein
MSPHNSAVNLRTRLLLDLKAIRVGKGNFRRLQRRDDPRIQDAIASGRIEAVDARGRVRLTRAQVDRRSRRGGLVRPATVIGRASDGSVMPVSSSRPFRRAARSSDLMEAAMIGRKPKRKRRSRRAP